MKNKIREIIDYGLHHEFQKNPYDFTSYEIEAQFKLAQKIREKITDFATVDLAYSVPEIKGKTNRVKLEWKLKDGKHDIVIFKPETIFGGDNLISYENVECFIEIKCGWGESPNAHFSDGVKKDLELLKIHPEIGMFIGFISNNFNAMSEKSKKLYEEKFYEMKDTYKIATGSMLYVFRDRILE